MKERAEKWQITVLSAGRKNLIKAGQGPSIVQIVVYICVLLVVPAGNSVLSVGNTL